MGANFMETMKLFSSDQRRSAFLNLIHQYRKVGVLHSGGPASGANAVLAALSLQLNELGHSLIGFLAGFQSLVQFAGDVCAIEQMDLKPNQIDISDGAVMLGTSRANPGKLIKSPQDLSDFSKTVEAMAVLEALSCLHIGALVTIGGDDTMRTSNLLNMLGLPTVHVPKTVDKDYKGIDWTFGFWTASNKAADLIRIYDKDAKVSRSWDVIECMGRQAGWLTAVSAICGGSTIFVLPEDISGTLDVHQLASSLADQILVREKHGERGGAICVAEGLVDLLPKTNLPTDAFGHISLKDAKIGEMLAKLISEKYAEKAATEKVRPQIKTRAHVVGFETRVASPISYDIMLSLQLGRGAAMAVVQRDFGNMISCGGLLDLSLIPFADLIDPITLKAKNEPVPDQGDFRDLLELMRRWPR